MRSQWRWEINGGGIFSDDWNARSWSRSIVASLHEMESVKIIHEHRRIQMDSWMWKQFASFTRHWNTWSWRLKSFNSVCTEQYEVCRLISWDSLSNVRTSCHGSVMHRRSCFRKKKKQYTPYLNFRCTKSKGMKLAWN